jgi:hypothetical protein
MTSINGRSRMASPHQPSKISFSLPADRWKLILKTISAVHTQAWFEFRPEGLSFFTIDVANVELVEASFGKNYFTTYNVTEDVDVPVDMCLLNKIPIRKDSMVDVSMNDVGKAAAYNLWLRNCDRLFSVMTWCLLDKDGKPDLKKHKQVKGLTFAVQSVVDWKTMTRVIQDAHTVDCRVIFIAKDGELFAEAGTNESVKFETEMTTLATTCTEGITHRAAYSLDYLLDMCAVIKEFKTLLFQFSTDMPMKLQAADGLGFSVTYVLAPRVESD